MPLIDHRAAETLTDLRESQGHSPESLAADIKERAKTAKWGHRGTVDAWTIRDIEGTGRVPSSRVRFVLCSYFGDSIWFVPRKRRVTA